MNNWWNGMNTVSFVSKCLACQQVLLEHQRPARILQPLFILESKWEHIIMDFIVEKVNMLQFGLWLLYGPNLLIFWQIKWLILSISYLDFTQEIIRLYGVPLSIVSDKDPRLVSQFWESLQKAVDTYANLKRYMVVSAGHWFVGRDRRKEINSLG